MNLFTFNFKKFYISFVIFFLASILFFIIGSEIIIRYLVVQNSTYEIIRDDLRNKKNDFAVFADSRGANGFEDSKNFSNFSLPGNNLMSIIKMAEFHIEKNQLKGIIVQLDPHLFSNYRLFDNQSKLMFDLLTEDRNVLFMFRPQYKKYLFQYWTNLPKKLSSIFFGKQFNKKQLLDSDDDFDKLKKETLIRVQMHKPIKNFINSKHFLYLNNFLKKLKIRNERSTKKKPSHEWIFTYSRIIFFSTVPSS